MSLSLCQDAENNRVYCVAYWILEDHQYFNVSLYPIILRYSIAVCTKSFWSSLYPIFVRYELRHDKTNKVSVRLEKTQISLGIRPVWSESSLAKLRTQGFFKLRTQGFFMRTAKTLIRLGGCPGWSESSLGAQPLCWFCHVRLIYWGSVCTIFWGSLFPVF